MIGTEDNPGTRVLSVGRQVGGYVIAADILNLKNLRPNANTRFQSWLSALLEKDLGNHGRWKSIVQTHENSANNWGTFAGATRVAICSYLGKRDDLEQCAAILRAHLGDRSAYQSKYGRDNYFESTTDFSQRWSAAAPWVAVNPANTKDTIDGVNIAGAPVEDISRGGNAVTDKGIQYSNEALQGIVVQALVLERMGYTDVWQWEDQAIRRIADFIDRVGGTNRSQVDCYIPWVINSIYGTSYRTKPEGAGRIVGWTDWTHRKRRPRHRNTIHATPR